jgi:hypothetical protein
MGQAASREGRCGRLEPYEAEVSRTVLRGRGWREPLLLPDVRHDVADVSVLLSAERIDNTCCSASSILPGRASPVTALYEAPGIT